MWGRIKQPKPISSGAKRTDSPWVLLVVCSLFTIIGITVLIVMYMTVVQKAWESRTWRETPCEILSSSVSSHSSDDGTTYRVEVTYSYTFNENKYQSNRYKFMHGSSSGHRGKQAIVDSLPPGTRTVCYVNPEQPSEAVLKKGVPWEILFGLIPLVFVIFGVAGLLYAIRQIQRGPVKEKGWLLSQSATGMPAEPAMMGGRIVLKPAASRKMKFFLILFFTLVWNGVNGVLVWQIVQGFQQKDPSWFIVLFSVPFLGVGLFMIGATIYGFLVLFNPLPRLTLSAAAVPLGGVMEIQWEMMGAAYRINRLRITLKGIERCQYTRGTKTYTDTETFYESELTNTNEPADMRMGSIGAVIPPDAMHSFKSHKNQIEWSLCIQGEISFWPDIKEEFPILILPVQAITGDAA